MSDFDAWLDQRVPADPLVQTIKGVDFLIPADPPWAWSTFVMKAQDESKPETERVTRGEQYAAVVALFDRTITRDRAGCPAANAGRKVWVSYAQSIGVEHSEKATRDDIRAACTVKVSQLDEFGALGLGDVEVGALLEVFVPITYGTSAGNSPASDAA